MRRLLLIVATCIVVFSFAACTPIGLPMMSPATPDARATEARMAMNIFATLTASAPTASSTPAVTVAPPRANTPVVKNTPRPAATRTATLRPRPTSTSTPVPPPTVDLFADKSLPGPIAKNALTNLEGKWEMVYVGDFRDKTVFNSSPDLNENAAGVWVTAQFRVRNLQPAVTYLGRDYRFTAIDQNGRIYEEDSDATRNAGWQYCGCSDAYDDVQPGQETVIVVTFDVPESTKTLAIAFRQGWSSQLMPSPRFQIVNVNQIPAWRH
jgi:hypothetical protein